MDIQLAKKFSSKKVSQTHPHVFPEKNSFIEYPSNKTIHQLFEEQVENNPNHIAIIFEGSSLTYRELNERSNQLAFFLKEKGVNPDTLVAIACDRSPDFVIGILAILKAGGAYVPLDQSYPFERLVYMMEDINASVLLTQSHLKDHLPTTKASVVLIDNPAHFKNYPTHNVGHTSSSRHLAYVIYTSGSTGKPKGVMIEHRNVNRLVFAQHYVKINASSVIAQAANISFDATTFEIWGALLHGAKLVMVPSDIALSALNFDAFLKTNKISGLFLTTALFNKLIQEKQNIFESIDFLLFGGELVNSEIVNLALQYKPKNLIHVYGPTEGTTFTTAYTVKNTISGDDTVPIGKPLSNTHVYILDASLCPVAVGVVGELYVGGDGLARGYLNQPNLTAERFIDNPFATEREKQQGINIKLYKTGDLCRYSKEGNVEYVGRIDNQIKLRGFRIELGEIESALKQHRDVKDAVVILREDTPGDKKLVAYAVFKQAFIDTKGIRTFLKNKLPDYMIPSAFVTLNHFPLTPNGKVDKKALPKPIYQNENECEEARTDIEKVLVPIWEEILKINGIGIHADFFMLGGHSLLAASIVMKVNNHFNIKLNIKDILISPTIAALAKKIESLPKQACDFQKPKAFVGNKINIPLTSSQQQIWFHLQEAEGELIYNEPLSITMNGREISPAILEKCINELLSRHEILRARISFVEGVPVQNIFPYSFFNLPFIDLSSMQDPEKCLEEAYKIATREAKKAFDLEKDSLIRFSFVKLRNNLYKLFIVAHHIIIDGISVYKVLLPELMALYKAFSNNIPANLPNIDFQYSDYALWNHNRIFDDSKENLFWKKTLSGAQDIHFGKTKQGFKGKREVLAFEKSVSEGIRNLGSHYGLTHFVIFMAALNVLLYKLTGQKDLCIVSVVSGRNQSFLENICGNFLNSVIFRNNVFESLTFADFLVQVNKNALDVYENQELSFQQVSTLMASEKNERLPLSVALVLEPPLAKNELNWELSQLEIHTDTAKFPLTIELDERSEGVIGRIEYNTSLFNAPFIQDFINKFSMILQQVINHPKVKISDIDILSKEERQKILVGWNNTKREYPSNKTIHQLFEEQVKTHPNHIAVIFEDNSLTYGELNQKANQLAQFLKQKGVREETLVAIMCERSGELIIGILAILKAGGAYVPLDPNYPPERLVYMMEDTKASLLLTQSHLKDHLPNIHAEVILLDHNFLFKNYSTSNLERTSYSDHLAYVIYTSGSTGKPKGVMIEHKNICNRLFWWQEDITLEKSDKFLHQFSFSFDGAVVSLWWPLLNGVTVVIPSSQKLMDVDHIIFLIQKYEITSLFSTPAIMDMLYKQFFAKKINYINKIMLGGESFTQEMHQKLSQLKQSKIYNFYGPTESTIIATSYDATDKEIITATVPIGTPVANTQVYILDTSLRPVVVGVVGELYVGGEGLARGYFNRPELTAERFINNPFATEVEKQQRINLKLYKTGDLCRYLEDGNIEYVGRIDDQIKLRGFRIELGEIESGLKQHAEVKDALVILREDTPADKKLVAYIILNKNAIDLETVKSFLKSKLPGYMIPSYFVAIDDFPLTPNGKFNKKALPMPEKMESRNCMAPRNALEKKVCAVWADVLGLQKDAIGISDDFFEIGGDSISSMKLVNNLRQRLEININVSHIFIHRTIKKLYDNVLSKDINSEIASTYQNDEQGTLIGELPLLPIQEWFFSNNFKMMNHWNQSFLLKTPRLDLNRLQECIDKLVKYHDIFRVRFKKDNVNRYIQYYATNMSREKLNILDVKTLEGKENSVEFESNLQKILTEWQAYFDIENGPIYSVGYLHNYKDNSSRIYFAIHHLMIDAVSWRIIFEDLKDLYEGKTLPPKRSSYRQWTKVIKNYANTDRNEKNYWINVLSDYNKTTSVQLEKLISNDDFTHHIELSLSHEKTQQFIRETNKAYHTELNDILLTALGYALANITGSIVNHIMLEGHGRENIYPSVDVTRTLGWFTTMYPVRLKINEKMGNSIKYIKETLRHIPHKGIGFGPIIGYQHNNLPKIMFNYLGQFDSVDNDAWHFVNESSGDSIHPVNQNNNIITINCLIINNVFKLQLESKLDKNNTNKLANLFLEKLDEIIEHCITRNAVEATMSDYHDFKPCLMFNEQDQTDQKRLFMFPPALGDANSYMNNIIPKLSGKSFILFNNYYDFLTDKVGKNYTHQATYEELASQYICYIKSIQATGPYHLFGWSFGGILAFEVFRQLISEGDSVASLVMVDPMFNYKASVLQPNISFHQAENHINYNYAPLFKVELTSVTKIVLFKASDEVDPNILTSEQLAYYNTFTLPDVFKYYTKNTQYNHLDSILSKDKFEVKVMPCSHISWLNSNSQLTEICDALS